MKNTSAGNMSSINIALRPIRVVGIIWIYQDWEVGATFYKFNVSGPRLLNSEWIIRDEAGVVTMQSPEGVAASDDVINRKIKAAIMPHYEAARDVRGLPR